jgi:hypothetical protein
MTRIPNCALVAAVAAPLFACAPQPAAEMPAVALGESVDCIPVDRIVSRRPEGAQSLRFELTGGDVYRNTLDRACPPLEQATDFDIITLRLDGNRACYGDEFQIVDPTEARAVGFRSFPRCRLGRFVRVRPGG